MSLRDQLQKAGLANKKQARKAKNAARKEASAKRKKERQGQSTEDELTLEIKKKQEAQKAKDLELNRQIVAERERREKIFQIADILLSHDQTIMGYSADETYYFVVEESQIHRVLVSAQQQKSLSKGKLAIVKGGPVDDSYRLLHIDQATKIRSLDPSLIACLHPEED